MRNRITEESVVFWNVVDCDHLRRVTISANASSPFLPPSVILPNPNSFQPEKRKSVFLSESCLPVCA
ncbi:hypothetical protein VTL71DRAFT_5423 [Oculimacula yallundae]|uniref:Uncharacterized protein n=1 Tax=Oculimacula yallundae TaxID=86028 RepID=A0ABR4C108_9HELO